MLYDSHHNMMYTHIPVHSSQLERRWVCNVHGHTHSTMIVGENSEKYYNVCLDANDLKLIKVIDILDHYHVVY